jgi:hypothetical protein
LLFLTISVSVWDRLVNFFLAIIVMNFVV